MGMKVKVFGILFFLLGVFLTGCGKDSADKNITDVAVEREYFPNFEENFCRDGEEHSIYYMNMQFLGEVPVQFWAEKYEKKANDDHDSILIADIYLWSINGEQKLLLKEIDIEYVQQYKWFQDQEGCFYLISNLGVSDLVVKLDSQGKEIFKV